MHSTVYYSYRVYGERLVSTINYQRKADECRGLRQMDLCNRRSIERVDSLIVFMRIKRESVEM